MRFQSTGLGHQQPSPSAVQGRETLTCAPQAGVGCEVTHHLDELAQEGTKGANSLVSRSQCGRRLGTWQIGLSFSRWLAQVGISSASSGQAWPFSIHSLRHTFATRLYRKTGDLYLVEKALGHRQITTTEIYASVEDEAVRRAVGLAS